MQRFISRRPASIVNCVHFLSIIARTQSSLLATPNLFIRAGRSAANGSMRGFKASAIPSALQPIAVKTTTIALFDGELLTIPFYKSSDKAVMGSIPEALSLELKDVIADAIKQEMFDGEKGSEFVIRTASKKSPKFLALIGLGARKSSSGDVSYALGKAIAAASGKTKSKEVGIFLEDREIDLHKLSLGIYAGQYDDTRFKRKEAGEEIPSKICSLHIIHNASSAAKIELNSKKSLAVASGVQLARDLVGAPSNVKTPPFIANVFRNLSEKHGFELKILGQSECAELNMGGYLAVQQGSRYSPEFVHMVYKPAVANATKKIVLIGKGLTFDSGGYNLKVGAASSIELMKMDMGGCAAILGCADAIGALRPENVEVHFISAVCENMISASAVRPGDVVTASNGKTIEVVNTDAEGRLTLADALVYAENLGNVDAIVDLATLTGACIVGLGDKVSGLYSSDEKLRDELLAAAKSANEKVWHMPLEDEYRSRIKSPIANIQNVGGSGGGGSITAALFLQEFVTDKTPWAHIDIAGPVWDSKTNQPTGHGVMMLVEYLLRVNSN